MTKKEPILCYIDGPWAYFTTQSLQKQWGDDWDDRPYECNAGTPYGPCWHREKEDCQCDICKRDWNTDGTPKWEIVKIAWDGDFCAPSDWIMAPHNDWSVRDINNKCVPWLQRAEWKIGEPRILIWAGTTLSRFKKLIQKNGGSVYVEET